MSEPIRVGDLVVVVRWPCCVKDIGYVGMVDDLFCAPAPCHCANCGRENIAPAGEPVATVNNKCNFPLAWLKRIPPLSELEGAETKDEVPA